MADKDALQRTMLGFQRAEITGYQIYLKLAQAAKSAENSRVLTKVANDELAHYHFWRSHTGRDVAPNTLAVWWYYLLSRLLGFTFGVKLMERGEKEAEEAYGTLRDEIPQIDKIIAAESEHENSMLDMLDEESLRYTGSIVLGLNDALVELTGALAGLTLALQNGQLIALTGLITGIAAALSMGTSEYLSTKTDSGGKNPLRAAIYTGVAYIFTVAALIMPYLLLQGIYLPLACTLAIALLIIATFNFYVSVAKDLDFKARFLEMAGLSLGVAAISFLVGYVVRILFGVDV